MEQHNHSSPSFINIAVLLLFAVVIAVASAITTYFFLSSRSGEQYSTAQSTPVSPPQTYVQPTTIPITTTQTVTDETAGWKVYRNERYGFEFQYPEGEFLVDGDLPTTLRIQEQNNIIKIRYNVYPDFESGWEIKIYQNNSKKALKDWLDSTFDKKANIDCNEIESNIKIKNAYTLLFSSHSMDERCDNGGYYTISPDKLTIVRWGLGNDIPRGFDEISSTFKFTR